MSAHDSSPELSDATCTLCGELAQVDSPWEVTWSQDCASSVHDLVDLYDLSFFVEANYCLPCKELVRDIHFMTNGIAVLRHRLDMAKAKVLQMLKTGSDMDAYVPEHESESESGEECSEGEFECEYSECGTSFRTMNGLTKHNQTHLDNDIDLNCSVEGCGKSFGRKSHLTRHLKYVHSINNKAHRARLMDKCKKKFVSHSKNANKKAFHCEEAGCEEIFAQRLHLARHLRNVHFPEEDPTWRPQRHRAKLETSEKFLKCSVKSCGKEFGRKSHLTRHLKNMHQPHKTHRPRKTFSDKFKAKFGSDTTSIDDESVFACSEAGCGKVFGRNSHLTRHLENVHFVKESTPMRDSEPRSLRRNRGLRSRAD